MVAIEFKPDFKSSYLTIRNVFLENMVLDNMYRYTDDFNSEYCEIKPLSSTINRQETSADIFIAYPFGVLFKLMFINHIIIKDQ